ncbi:MAG TPA: DegT/DnrJ/EryC1/StrS family aminotransferase [Bacillota bacterium]|nr:DegT/DnrJ/EryC1/StrS family aminotransferase [Bacillota bacterium]
MSCLSPGDRAFVVYLGIGRYGKEDTMRVRMASPYHSTELEEAVISVLRSGRLIQGEKVMEFENALAEYLGCKHVIAVSSGTAALHLAFMALGVRPGDEVITTPFSFASSANAILYCGGTPVFVDIDPETFNIDPDLIEQSITPRTVGIEPVHLYGQPAEMDKIKAIADKYGLFIVEDAAQAIGAKYRGKKIGTIGDIACFSTYTTKNLHTMEGGFLTTSDDDLALRLRRLRNIGQESKYNHTLIGYNYRMTEVAAVIGIEQVKLIDEFSETRRSNAAYITDGLSALKDRGIMTPYVAPHIDHVFHQYTVSIDANKAGMTRDDLALKLRDSGIETGIHYPVPIYDQPCFRAQFGSFRETCPVTEEACASVLSLPVHTGLSGEDLDHIIKSISTSFDTSS